MAERLVAEQDGLPVGHRQVPVVDRLVEPERPARRHEQQGVDRRGRADRAHHGDLGRVHQRRTAQRERPVHAGQAACAARLSDSPGTVMYPPELASINAWIEVGSVNAATYRLDTGSPGPGGSAGIVGATRSSCSSGSPIQKSSPSGPATSSRKYVPNVRPLTRRITSPTRKPKVSPW